MGGQILKATPIQVLITQRLLTTHSLIRLCIIRMVLWRGMPISYRVWPNWSDESSPDARAIPDYKDIYLTGGWFYIQFNCPDVITTDSGNQTLIHIKAGHLYRFEM